MSGILSDIRYSARSLARTPGTAIALLFTIALGIGSNVVVHGFVRGLIPRGSPLTAIDGVVSLFGRDAYRETGPVSYEDYLSLKGDLNAFEWIGAARVSQCAIIIAGQSSILSVGAVTPDLAGLLELSPDEGIVISHKVWQSAFRGMDDVRGRLIRIDGVDARVGGVAPEWLEGVYSDRAVDLWMPLREGAIQAADRSSRNFWVIGRLRRGVSLSFEGSGEIRALPYTGMTPEQAAGLARVSRLLGAAAGFVFVIACGNVALFLLGRASARSQETSLRVALGASRGQLARALLADSIVISVAGGALGVLLSMWTSRVVPALLFEQDAQRLVFAPDLMSIAAASCACVGITIICGLMPMIENPHARPAAVLRRGSAGPSRAIQHLRSGLVVTQMASVCLLVVFTALLFEGLRTALQTAAGHRLGRPILATVQAHPDTGRRYFDGVGEAAKSITGASATVWAGRLPGGEPTWQSFRIEPEHLPLREVKMDIAWFTAESLRLFTLPPSAGRLFGFGDEACRVAIVNEEAADGLFGKDTVGRSVQDPARQPVEIIGVVAMQRAERVARRSRPTIYYNADESGLPPGGSAMARFRAPAAADLARAELDTNVVSSSYFDAMGLSLVKGRTFADNSMPRVCRVAVINQEADDQYFGGKAIGAAVIDASGRRTEILGVVHSPPHGTFQRRAEPGIYFPMAQDYLPYMTLIIGARNPSDAMLADLRQRIETVPGRGPAPVIVKTLDAHLKQTALAPLRIATMIVGASATTALLLSILGLFGVLSETARQRRREVAIRIAVGAQRWHVIRQVLGEGARLACAGSAAGVAGSLLIARFLAQIIPGYGSPALWVWLVAPLVLAMAVAIASVLPARRALIVDPLTIMRDDV